MRLELKDEYKKKITHTDRILENLLAINNEFYDPSNTEMQRNVLYSEYLMVHNMLSEEEKMYLPKAPIPFQIDSISFYEDIMKAGDAFHMLSAVMVSSELFEKQITDKIKKLSWWRRLWKLF